MISSRFDKKGQIKKGYFPPKEKVKYIKVLCNGKTMKIARKSFKGDSIEKIRALIEKAGLIPVSFTELMLLVNGPYGGYGIPERASMNTFAKKLVKLNNCYYTNFRKEFGVANYEVCAGIGDYGSRNIPDIKSLNSPKYVGFTQVSRYDRQYIINTSQIEEHGLEYTFKLTHLDKAISIQARTTLDGYSCSNQHTFYPSSCYSPIFATEIIVESVGNTISKKHYIGFGKEK